MSERLDVVQTVAELRGTGQVSAAAADFIRDLDAELRASRAEVERLREREVELMAMAMFRHQWWNTPETPTSLVKLWRESPPEKEPYLGAAMELRDAYDRAAQPDCTECDGAGWVSGMAHHSQCDGSCRNCPVQVQEQCGACRGTGRAAQPGEVGK